MEYKEFIIKYILNEVTTNKLG